MPEQVWRRYADDSAAVRSLVTSIRAIAEGVVPEHNAAKEPEPDEAGVLEGRLIYRLHRRRERDPALRVRKLKQLERAGHRATCQVCGLVPDSVFGPGCDQVLECHHIRPLRLGQRRTQLADVALLCATCHTAIHARGLLVTLEDLRDALRAEFRAAMRAVAES